VQARIAQLTEQLNKLNSINTAEIAEDRVGLGSTIDIAEQDSSFKMTLTFVIDAEADPGAGKLSLSTPYGRAFQGHMAGDVVEVNTPVGAKVFVLKKLTTIHGKTFEA
jgi:transcription elongation factor GreA